MNLDDVLVLDGGLSNALEDRGLERRRGRQHEHRGGRGELLDPRDVAFAFDTSLAPG